MSAAVRVAYQGEPGAYSEAAAVEAFKPTGLDIECVGFSTFDEVFKALSTGSVEYAAVPVENTLGGSIHINYDLMLRYHGKVHAVGEHSFRVRHALLALPGVEKGDIKRVMSHPQALAQTEQYQKTSGIEPVPAYDTAGSAKLVREENLRDTAAIASSRAAEVHGLEVLDYGIEDDSNNFTRFLLLARYRCNLREDALAKTSVVFVPKRNEVGVLHKALSAFAQRDIDLSKIESRPFKPSDTPVASLAGPPPCDSPAAKRPRVAAATPNESSATASFGYAFYLDLLAQDTAPNCQNAFRHLEELTRFVKVLGTYPVEGIQLPARMCDEARHETANIPHADAAEAQLSSPLRIGVIGFGTFGQFLSRRWARRGHVLFAQSRTDYSSIAESIGVAYVKTAAELLTKQLDVIVISVSILSFEKVLRSLPVQLLTKALVVDVLSVKQFARSTMLSVLPPDADILCTHPMFGPDSGAGSWQGLPCVFEQTRITDFHRSARFISLFEDEGCRMVRMPCKEHDALAASSQFVTHFTGRLLSKMNLKPSPIATAGFKALLKLVENTCSDSFDLFYALYAHNPASSEQLQTFEKAFSDLRRDLTAFTTTSDGHVAPQGSEIADSGASGESSCGAMTISKLISSIELSRTVAISDKAAQLKGEGKNLVSLSVGEPDILPPYAVMNAAHASLDAGHVKYTECSGLKALREAISDYLRVEKGTCYKVNEIVCSNGGKQSLFQAMLALCDPGDEVVVPAPYWVSYTQMAAMCGAASVVIPTKEADGYCLMPDDLEAALTPRSRVLILCNPSNPTGAVHPAPLLERLAAVLREWPRVVIIADEIYEQITYDEPHVAFATLPGMYDRTVTINGFSKGPAMTGFRLGYLAAPLPLAAACVKVQSQNTSAPCSVSQYAAIAAIREPDAKWMEEAIKSYRQKRDYVIGRLRGMPGVSHAYIPQGAFYAFPSVAGCFGKRTPCGIVIRDAEGVCLYLLEKSLVAMVPGEAFGDGKCLRISYAASMETLTASMDRMEAGIRALH